MELHDEEDNQELCNGAVQRSGLTPQADARSSELTIDDELVFPAHKRVFAQYWTSDEGITELRLYYGEKEISFDDPALFEFGENLAAHARFTAGVATTWGAAYGWPRVRELLQQLIDEGILQHATTTEILKEPLRGLGRPSPLPPVPCISPHTWLESEEITRRLTGRCLDLGYLELVIPVYRIAHIALDAEGRQLGEANVFPPALRLEIPTEWRACPHAGSRYQDHRPMNVTGLKSMRLHWGQMMLALLQVRRTYLRRFPHAHSGWTVGDVHCLSALVLSIPAFLMLRTHQRIMNGQLHPALSSMYRVVDGVRMVMHHKLFSADIEPTVPMDTPIDSTEIYAYAERNSIFHSDYGVCAGPRQMIEELLQVLLDGRSNPSMQTTTLDAPLQSALDEIESVFDYVLHGLQAYAVVFWRWPEMTRTYEKLVVILERWSGSTTVSFHTFQQRLQRSVKFLRNETRQNTEERREQRLQVYSAMHARSLQALGMTQPYPLLSQCVAPTAVGNDAQARTQLGIRLQQRLCVDPTDTTEPCQQLVEVLMDFFRQEQAVIRYATSIQERVNELLGRAAPVRQLSGADLAIHQRLLAATYSPTELSGVGGRLPYLVDELEEELGLRVVVRGEAIEIAAEEPG